MTFCCLWSGSAKTIVISRLCNHFNKHFTQCDALGIAAFTLAGKHPGTTLTKHVTNVRVLSSPFWRGTLANQAQRCLVLFSRFAEPGSGKGPVTGRPAERWFEVNHAPIAAFAGIWRPSQVGNVYAFLIRAPNVLVNPYLEKAMPVILFPEDYDRWLSGSSDDVKALQAPFPSQLMGLSTG